MRFKFYWEVEYNTVIAVTDIKVGPDYVWAVVSDILGPTSGEFHRQALSSFYVLNECMSITEESARLFSPQLFDFLADEREEYYPV